MQEGKEREGRFTARSAAGRPRAAQGAAGVATAPAARREPVKGNQLREARELPWRGVCVCVCARTRARAPARGTGGSEQEKLPGGTTAAAGAVLGGGG